MSVLICTGRSSVEWSWSFLRSHTVADSVFWSDHSGTCKLSYILQIRLMIHRILAGTYVGPFTAKESGGARIWPGGTISIRTLLFLGGCQSFHPASGSQRQVGACSDFQFGFNKSLEKCNAQMTLFLSPFWRPQATIHCRWRSTCLGKTLKDTLVDSVSR